MVRDAIVFSFYSEGGEINASSRRWRYFQKRKACMWFGEKHQNFLGNFCGVKMMNSATTLMMNFVIQSIIISRSCKDSEDVSYSNGTYTLLVHSQDVRRQRDSDIPRADSSKLPRYRWNRQDMSTGELLLIFHLNPSLPHKLRLGDGEFKWTVRVPSPYIGESG